MERLFLAATILVSSLTLAQAQMRDILIPRPPSPYYAPYAPYPYMPYAYAPYYSPQRIARPVAATANPGIAAVQRRLQELGFLPRTASIDGVAGAQTQRAIANWQRSLVHPMTGLLTPAEVQALFEPPPVNPTPSPLVN
jgi:hypothetical protein